MTTQRVYSQRPGVVTRNIAGETLLVCAEPPPPGSARQIGDFFVLNETGRELWSYLAKPRSRAEMAHWLHTNFDVDSQQAAQDVDRFLGALREYGMLFELEQS